MRELKAKGLWARVGKQIKHFPFFYIQVCMGIIRVISVNKRMGRQEHKYIKGPKENFIFVCSISPGYIAAGGRYEEAVR